MADRGVNYGSLGRQALASTFSTLDGVPFKISTNFRQPPKVINVPVLEGSGTCNALNEEYTYETEQAVLTWARARDEAIKKAQQGEAEKAAKAAAIAQREAAAAKQNGASNEIAQNSESVAKTDQSSSSTTAEGVGVPLSTSNNQSQVTLPKPAPRPGSILKPTPIHQTNKSGDGTDSTAKKNSASGNSIPNETFDPKMFEAEADPFDNLELQTINDMEELKVLLDPASNLVSVSRGQGEQALNSSNNSYPDPKSDSNVPEGLYELAQPINTDAWVTFDNTDSSSSNHGHGGQAMNIGPDNSDHGRNNSNNNIMASSSDSNLSDAGDYVKLADDHVQPNSLGSSLNGGMTHSTPDPSTNNANGNTITQASNPDSNPFGSANLAPHLAGSGLFKPVLPPIPKPRQSTSSTVIDNSLPQNETELANCSTLPSSTNDAPASNKSYYPSGKQSNAAKPTRVAPPPPLPNSASADVPNTDGISSSSKMWSSVGPSLANSLDNGVKEGDGQANPYSRHSREWHGAVANGPEPPNDQSGTSPTPSDQLTQSASSSQLWNRYRPLPPAPSPKPGDVGVLPKPQRPVSRLLGLTDPFHSLSREAQEFTDNITSMGFLRAKVARAVDKFGQDEKEVLDHLIAVDVLVQKKFAPLYVEMALHKYHNDCEKAERFLKMQSQFEELGFPNEKIQDALIKTDMNHDKALDLLTACSP